MPMPVKRIMETPEEFLFSGRDNLGNRILMFLKRNEGTGYTITELKEQLANPEGRGRITNYDVNLAIKKMEGKEPICRKGSYYWWREIDGKNAHNY